MKKVIDIHSHILPGVDDGCRTRAEAVSMLKMYEEQGAEAVVCTPHYGICGKKGADVEGAFAWLCSVGSPVKLYLGNEILLDRHSLQDVRLGIARRIPGSDRILIEFDEWEEAGLIANEVRRAAGSEFVPVLAHAERYRNLQGKPELYRQIMENGAEIQINAWSICEEQRAATLAAAQWLLQNRLVSYIGSDAHGADKRPPRLATGVQWIYDNCPEEYADDIVHNNAAGLLGLR